MVVLEVVRRGVAVDVRDAAGRVRAAQGVVPIHVHLRVEDIQVDRSIELTVEITKDCNLDCSYCMKNNSGQSPYPENDTFDIDKFTDFMRKGNFSILMISGGEPLLRRDYVYTIINEASGKIPHIKIATNGSLVTDEDVKFFNEHNVSIMLSTHGGIVRNADRFKNIAKRIMKYVVEPPFKFSETALRLIDAGQCRLEIAIEQMSMERLTEKDIKDLDRELNASGAYTNLIYQPINHCKVCPKIVVWRCDNSVTTCVQMYKKLYGRDSFKYEGVCPHYIYSEGASKNLKLFMEVAGKYYAPSIVNVKDAWEYNRDMLVNKESVRPRLFNEGSKKLFCILEKCYEH